jgi:hypothetical protein
VYVQLLGSVIEDWTRLALFGGSSMVRMRRAAIYRSFVVLLFLDLNIDVLKVLVNSKNGDVR